VRNPPARSKIDKTSAFVMVFAAEVQDEGRLSNHHLLVYDSFKKQEHVLFLFAYKKGCLFLA
jgi:hypothetical protein